MSVETKVLGNWGTPFESLCNRLNRGLMARQISSQARYEGKAIHIHDSKAIPNELIESIFQQAWNESKCAKLPYKYSFQKDAEANWKISFTISGESLRKTQISVGVNRSSDKMVSSVPNVQSQSILKEKLEQATLQAVEEYLNRHEETEGIWYLDDYRKCLLTGYDIEMPAKLVSGYANDRYFNKVSPFVFVLKEGVRASEALLAFLKGPTIADCGNATTACYYKAVLDVLGAGCFDRMFGSGPFALRIDQLGINNSESPLSLIADFTEAAKRGVNGSIGKRPLSIGEECHIQGVVFYGNKHPLGFGGGFNVIYKGDNEQGEQLFIGHGLSRPCTEREIIQRLVDQYNQERTPQDMQHIKELNRPNLYDRKVNVHLQHFYTLPLEIAMMQPKKIFGGYWPGSPRCLDINAISSIKAAEDPLQMMFALQRVRR